MPACGIVMTDWFCSSDQRLTSAPYPPVTHKHASLGIFDCQGMH